MEILAQPALLVNSALPVFPQQIASLAMNQQVVSPLAP
jgi:hypothetical protein